MKKCEQHSGAVVEYDAQQHPSCPLCTAEGMWKVHKEFGDELQKRLDESIARLDQALEIRGEH